MGQNWESRNKSLHSLSVHFYECQDNLIKKEESFQQMVQEQLDISEKKKLRLDTYLIPYTKKLTPNGWKDSIQEIKLHTKNLKTQAKTFMTLD